MADAYPNQRTTVAPASSGLSAGRFGGVGPFSGGPFNLGWVPIAVGLLAVVGGLIYFFARSRTGTQATAQTAPTQPAQTGAQSAVQGSSAPAAATLVPLPYPTAGAVENVPPTQPTQPAASSLGTVTLTSQPTGGQQATQPGPPFVDPSTGQVLSTVDGPFFQWGQQLQATGPPNAQGIVPVVGPSGGIVGIPNVDIASWNNPSASSLSSFSPTAPGQGQVTS